MKGPKPKGHVKQAQSSASIYATQLSQKPFPAATLTLSRTANSTLNSETCMSVQAMLAQAKPRLITVRFCFVYF